MAFEEVQDDEVIILEDEDGTEHGFVLGEVLTVEAQDYAVLVPIEEDVEEGVIFRIESDPNGDGDTLLLAEIESDEEWQKVVDVYNESVDEDFED